MSKISAFGIYKNINSLDYPATESISSLLPIVDEFVCNVGDQDTFDTLDSFFSAEGKVKLFRSDWAGKEKGTQFFSEETNKALDQCQYPLAFMLQADEVVHEKDLSAIVDLAKALEESDKVGATFEYLHFAESPNKCRKNYFDGGDAYVNELRLFKNDGRLISFGDAQSFCFAFEDYFDPRGPQPALHRKDRFLYSMIPIYHYGYLKSPQKILEKKKYLRDFYDTSEPGRQEPIPEKDGAYIFDPSTLREFTGNHPSGMKNYLERFK